MRFLVGFGHPGGPPWKARQKIRESRSKKSANEGDAGSSLFSNFFTQKRKQKEDNKIGFPQNKNTFLKNMERFVKLFGG